MKATRIISLVLALIMLCTACGSRVSSEENVPTEEKRVFVDSCGREVLVDKEITKVALSGTLAQIVVFALAPEKMVGLVSEWDSMAKEYLATEYYQMPVIGQLYGGKGETQIIQHSLIDLLSTFLIFLTSKHRYYLLTRRRQRPWSVRYQRSCS